MEVAIIADDLTGAADAAAPFAQRGYEARVGFKGASPQEAFPLAEGDVLAYDTATRDIPDSQAETIQATVRQAARCLAQLQPRIVFKKIDSTLRGHLRLELEAVRAEFSNRLAIVSPAFPAQGRTVRAGVLHIHNTPWTATEFAPKDVSGSATVLGAFGMAGKAGTGAIVVSEIQQGVEALEARLQEAKAQGIHTVFCDAETDQDLNILAQTILRQPETYLPVGSAGLARALAAALPAGAQSIPTGGMLTEPLRYARVLVVVGSLHAASRRQAQVLAARAQMPPVVIEHTGDVRQNLIRAGSEIGFRYECGEFIITLTTPDAPDAQAKWDFGWMPGSIAQGVCVNQGAIGQGIDALVICGGNTAAGLCQMCDAIGLRVLGEWEPGVAYTHLIVAPDAPNRFVFHDMPLVTKAGGFGDAETLARLLYMQP